MERASVALRPPPMAESVEAAPAAPPSVEVEREAERERRHENGNGNGNGNGSNKPLSSEAVHHLDARGYKIRRRLAAGDAVAIVVALGLAVLGEQLTGINIAPAEPLILLPVALMLWTALAGTAGLFHIDERRLDCSAADELARIGQLAAVWMWLLFLFETLRVPGPTPVGPAIMLWLLSIPAILLGRHVVRRIAQNRRWYRQTAVVVGRTDDVARVQTMLARHADYGVDVVRTATLPPVEYDGQVGALIRLIEDTEVDRVVFASHYEGLDERTGALRFLAERGVKVDLVPGDSEVFRSDAELHFVEGVPFLTLPTTARARSASIIKRAIDVCGAAVGLAVLSPLFAYWALRIKLDSPGPVFFRQRRTGLKGTQFDVMKFRTMVADAEEKKRQLEDRSLYHDGKFKLVDDPRVTRVGARLRRSSADELPQLVNVLRGDMSLVGPRPLPTYESEMIRDRYQARFKVRPGITGPWQVLGRSDIPFEDMLKLDYTYVTNWSISDDVKLLLRTMGAIARGRGAY